MFTIIGGDGKEYGPVTADQIRAWLVAGRANHATQAKAVGDTEWRRVGDFPEFASVIGAPPPIATGPGPTAAATAVPVAMDSNLADRAVRLGAAAIDWVLSSIAATPGFIILGSAVIGVVVEAMQGRSPQLENLDFARILLGCIVLAAGTLVLLVFQIWMISTRGQTIGKRLCSIRIVRFADGSQPGFLYGWVMRNLVPGIISSVPYIGALFWLVDVCFIFSKERRCLHDLIAGTKVVKA